MKVCPVLPLTPVERVYYRDRLRHGRHAALQSAEGFNLVCFAVEELGSRLHGAQVALGFLKDCLTSFVDANRAMGSQIAPTLFSSFDPLFEIVREARNDAMHTGAYARRVTAKAVELCLILEDALMASKAPTLTVGDIMVREPVCVEGWHPVARARQLMLMHSFSNLPLFIDGEWRLVNEIGLASYLTHPDKPALLATAIASASRDLGLVPAILVKETAEVRTLFEEASRAPSSLWLVTAPDRPERLLGVVSAFELL